LSNEDKIEELKRMIQEKYSDFSNPEEEIPEENFKSFENVTDDGLGEFQEAFDKAAEEDVTEEKSNEIPIKESDETPAEENNVQNDIETSLKRTISQEVQETIEDVPVEQNTSETVVKAEEPKAPKISPEELSPWEEFDNNNEVVKKYIIYIARDYVPYIDRLSVDQRSAYVNDAIQKKIDYDEEEERIAKKKNLAKHIVLFILTFFIAMPFMILIIDKAIIATMENYKYSQENFEKLYKHRFEKQKAYYNAIQTRNNRAYTKKVD